MNGILSGNENIFKLLVIVHVEAGVCLRGRSYSENGVIN